MMEALGMAPSQGDGPKPSLLEREMEMIGLLGNNTDDENDNGEETAINQQDSDDRTEIYKNSFPAKSPPRRPGRPVRRQRQQVD